MELLYIWLGKNKNNNAVFKKQGFKFTGEYEFSFDEKNNKLEIVHNDEYDTTFYKTDDDLKANVKLTCIVGKNGAGKSCLLEMLHSVLNKNIDTTLYFELDNYYDYLIVFKGVDKKIKTIEVETDFKLISHNLEDNTIFILKKENKITSYLYKDNTLYVAKENCSYKESDTLLDSIIKKISIINYCNSGIDYKFNPTNKENYYDVSTNFLLQHYHFNDIEHGVNIKLEKINTYVQYEIINKIKFNYTKHNSEVLNETFAINKLKREYFLIEPINNYDFETIKEMYLKYKPIISFISSIKKIIKQKLLDSNIYYMERVLWEIASQFLFLFFREAYQFLFGVGKNLNIVKYEIFYRTNLDDSMPEKLIISVLLNVLQSIDDSKYRVEEIEKINVLQTNIDDLYKILRFFIENNNKNKNKFNITLKEEHLEEKIYELINKYYDIKKYIYIGDFLAFSFYPRYSSGENALVTLFARIYNLKNRLTTDFSSYFNNTDTLIITLDEGEIGFHPEWSKEYIYAVLSYIQSLFKPYDNIKNIHFILTTNDPIILSDVLPNDIIYLENKKVKNKDISAFGSNILDLYSDDFFISNGLIGKYAQDKIEFVLNCVEKKKTNDECEFIIQSVGDENIRNYLHFLYNSIKNASEEN